MKLKIQKKFIIVYKPVFSGFSLNDDGEWIDQWHAISKIGKHTYYSIGNSPQEALAFAMRFGRKFRKSVSKHLEQSTKPAKWKITKKKV